MSGSSSPTPEPVETTHVVGIDIGMESCTMSCLTMDKRQAIKSTPFANSVQGFAWLFEPLAGLGVAPKQILVGLEATSRYGENLLQALLKHGYQVCLLHPAQMHAFAQQRRLRAKTDQLDAVTIARALLSGDARFGYVPSEQVATYRELMRLQHQLSDDVVRYKNEIHALLVVLFPEFTQVFVDPTRPTALAVLKRYRSRPGHRTDRGGDAQHVECCSRSLWSCCPPPPKAFCWSPVTHGNSPIRFRRLNLVGC